MWKIQNQASGQVLKIARDAGAVHPSWVHEQLGTKTEKELQYLLDNLDPRYPDQDARLSYEPEGDEDWIDDDPEGTPEQFADAVVRKGLDPARGGRSAR